MSEMFVTKRSGEAEPFYLTKIHDICKYVCNGLSDVDAELLANEVSKQVYPGIHTDTIYDIIVLTARTMMVNDDPNYSYVAARTLLLKLNREVVGKSIKDADKDKLYRTAFIENIKLMVEEGLLSSKLLEFDLEGLAGYLRLDRDDLIQYPGAQTLYDRYFINKDGRRLESLQGFFMRVAMGLSIHEEKKNEWAKRFYDKMSLLKYLPSTPSLFNSGTPRSQLSSCFISTVPDDLEGIFGTIYSQAMMSKWAGGLAVDWSYVRGIGSHIKGTNGKSQGVVPWMKVFNDTLVSTNQGGKRKGSGCSYLETSHIEIEEFLELKKNTGDERRRTHDMNTSNWIPDLFIKRVMEDGDWYLFCPSEAGELHDLYGEAHDIKYKEYENLADEGKIKNFKVVKAKSLWRKMLTSLVETGHPWICFKDPCNIRYTNKNAGVVHSSNLCCIAASGKVATDKGILTIRELYNEAQKPRYDLPPKNTVVGREKFETASPMLMPRPNAPMVKVCTKEGFEHKVTPDHFIYVKDKGWVQAKDIKVGEVLLGQQIPGGWGSEINAGRACDDAKKLRGQYIAEQHVPDYLWKSNKHTVKTYLDNLFWHPAPVWGLAYAKHKSFFQDLQILLANFGLIYEIKDFNNPMVFSGYSLQRKSDNELTFSHLEELPNEDAYCLEVESKDHAWTVDGLITKNTEITLHNSPTLWKDQVKDTNSQTAVCNLASPNLAAHVKNGKIDWDELADTISVITRGLDNVIDINYYPIDSTREANTKNRPIGVGLMGLADVYQMLDIVFDSEEAVKLGSKIQEFISFNAIKTSCELAKERGAFPTYEGSEWSLGNLPVDTYINLMKYRDSSFAKTAKDFETMKEWDELRVKIAKYGMRNSNTQSPPPSATISTISGCSPTAEPIYSVLFTYSTMSGELPAININFVNKCKELGIWNKQLIAKLKKNDGDIKNLHSLPQKLRDVFKTAFEVDQHKLIDAAAARQIWIDQSQSINLFYDGKSLKKLSEIYLHAWRSCLKTTYYLRSKGASRMEKVTVDAKENESGNGDLTSVPTACSIEAARNGVACESCQ